VSLSVDRYELGPIGTNSYVVRASDDAREAVVIDPGDAERLVSALDQRRASCAAILITHGHWDHLVGVAALADATGAPVHMAADERMLLEDATRWAPAFAQLQPSAPDERTAALIALLHALKCEHKVVDPRLYQMSRRQLRARAAEIAQGNWASEAVRKAIDQALAAVAAASAAATAATSG